MMLNHDVRCECNLYLWQRLKSPDNAEPVTFIANSQIKSVNSRKMLKLCPLETATERV